MNHFKKIILKILPKSIFKLLVAFYIYLKRYKEFYLSLFAKKHGMNYSSLFFPFTGQLKTDDFSLTFPIKFWSTWSWVIDIKELGGKITWTDDGLYICAEKDGIKVHSHPRDESMSVVFKEMFEEDEYNLDRYDFRGLNILDVGANIGDTALNFLKRGANHVHCFEPLEFLRNSILKNFSANGYENKTTLHMVALGDEDKYTNLYVRKHATAGSSVILHDAEFYEKKVNYDEVEVGIVNAERYLKEKNISNIDVLKLDCEHCEYTLFKNRSLLDYLMPSYVFIEYHDGFVGLKSVLQECGYKVTIEEKNENLGILTAINIS